MATRNCQWTNLCGRLRSLSYPKTAQRWSFPKYFGAKVNDFTSFVNSSARKIQTNTRTLLINQYLHLKLPRSHGIRRPRDFTVSHQYLGAGKDGGHRGCAQPQATNEKLGSVDERLCLGMDHSHRLNFPWWCSFVFELLFVVLLTDRQMQALVTFVDSLDIREGTALLAPFLLKAGILCHFLTVWIPCLAFCRHLDLWVHVSKSFLVYYKKRRRISHNQVTWEPGARYPS